MQAAVEFHKSGTSLPAADIEAIHDIRPDPPGAVQHP
jgi:hypothetical protein